MTWLIFFAACLACFRLTRLITDDKIFDWLRRDVSKAGKKAAEGIKCPFCVSFYVSIFIVGVLGLAIEGARNYSTWLWMPAIWGGSILLNQLFVKLSK